MKHKFNLINGRNSHKIYFYRMILIMFCLYTVNEEKRQKEKDKSLKKNVFKVAFRGLGQEIR